MSSCWPDPSLEEGWAGGKGYLSCGWGCPIVIAMEAPISGCWDTRARCILTDGMANAPLEGREREEGRAAA